MKLLRVMSMRHGRAFVMTINQFNKFHQRSIIFQNASYSSS